MAERAPDLSRDQRERFAPANPTHSGRRTGERDGDGPAIAPRLSLSQHEATRWRNHVCGFGFAPVSRL
jgi:hypothetical protein